MLLLSAIGPLREKSPQTIPTPKIALCNNKWAPLVWRKIEIFRSIDLFCWLSTYRCVYDSKCLECEFLRRFLAQGRQQSFWKFCILPNILHLKWCLSNKTKFIHQLSAMLTSRDGKGGKLSDQAQKCDIKAGVYLNRSEIWSNIKGDLLGLKWVGNTTRQLTTPKESPRLVADCLVSVY